MRYRTLGRTNIPVSVIGFGASPLGNVFGDISSKQAREAVAHAIDKGINIFDVSPYYGRTLAEERLGEALQGRREHVLLATKCGRYGVDHFEFSAKYIIREFEASLRRLRTECVDILQVHDVEFGSLEQIIHETIPALRSLQHQGKCRFIGITGYWPNLLAQIAMIGPLDTVLNYCHWNPLMNDMDRVLTPALRRSGIALLNASPLHMGLLGGGAIPDWHPAPPEVRQAANRFVIHCRQHGHDPATVALAQCLDHPYASSTFIGVLDRHQVDAAVDALTWKPTENFCGDLARLLCGAQNVTWPSGNWTEDVEPEG